MAKTVILSVHKNTVEGRRKRTQAREASRAVLGIMRQEDIRAYAFIAIGADGRSFSQWDTGACVPLRAFPAVVSEILTTDVHNSIVEGMADDWRAPIDRKA